MAGTVVVKHRLYNEYESANTGTATALQNVVRVMLEPVMQRMCDEGYAMREVSQLIQDEVQLMTAEMVLVRNTNIAAGRKQAKHGKH